MNAIYEQIYEKIGIVVATQEKIFSSILIIAILFSIRLAVNSTINKKIGDVKRQYIWRRWISYSTTLLAFLFVGHLWFKGIQSLSTFLGIASAGLLIALQDSVLNIAGWFFILARTPFRVGDRIEIGGISGDVIDIRLFQFSMVEIGNWVDADQSTGRIVHMPNGKIFKEALLNYTLGFDFIWHEIPVLVTFESNWMESKRILEKVASQNAESFSQNAEKEIKKTAEKYLIYFSKLTPVVYTTVRDCGVLLTIRYLTKPRERRITEQAMWEAILNEFAARSDIDFAYPTTRFYNNIKEGKPDARAGDDAGD